MKKRLVLGVLVALLLSTAGLKAQTFTAQIQQFWNLLRTGGLTFTNIKVTGGTITGVSLSSANLVFTSTLSGGTGVADSVHPFNATFNQNTNMQFLWFNNNAGAAAFSEIVAKSDTNVVSIAASGINSLPAINAQRGQIYTNTGSGTNGVPGLDVISCAGATPTLCFTRFLVNSADGTGVGEKARIDATGLIVDNALVLGFTATTGVSDAGISRISPGFLAVGNGSAGGLTGTIRAATFRVGAANSNAVTTSGTATVIKAGDSGNYLLVDNGVITMDSIQYKLLNSGSGHMLFSSVPGQVNSGFGTSPSLPTFTGSVTFRVTVGTGGVATTGVVGMTTANAGWNCLVSDETTNVATRQTANTTTTVTVTAASAWTAGDSLIFHCFAF